MGTLSHALSSTPPGTAELFYALTDGRPRTRSELAQQSGQSRSTIAARVDALLSLGLVAPAGQIATTGGRPSSTFVYAPSARMVLAVDLGASHARVAFADMSGAIMNQSATSIRMADGPDKVLDVVCSIARQLLDRLGRKNDEIIGVGIGVPAHVRPGTSSLIRPALMPGWSDFDLAQRLEDEFAAPVVVENDVNMMAIGERATAWPDVNDLMYVKVATGIGGGIIAGGALQRGAQGGAGDLGHMKLARASDVTCHCGGRGCVVSVASGPAVARALRGKGLAAETTDDVVELVHSGESVAIEAVRQAGRDIGEVLAAAVSLNNPAVIALGGSLSRVEHLIVGVREGLYSRAMPLAAEHLQVVQSAARMDAALFGASLLALEVAFASTNIADPRTAQSPERPGVPDPRISHRDTSAAGHQ